MVFQLIRFIRFTSKTWLFPDGFIGDDSSSRHNARWLAAFLVFYASLILILMSCSSSGITCNPRQPSSVNSGWTNFGKCGATSQLPSTFTFPSLSSNQVIGYVLTAPLPNFSVGHTVTLDYDVFLNGALGVADKNDTLPASLTLFFWQKGDNLSGMDQYAYYRWWCGTRGSLDNGNHVLSCPIDANWTSVNGTPGTLGIGMPPPTPASGFEQALNNLFAIGFTCGGAYFYGHGCWSAGGVTMKINSFVVQ
jgi:hypothetical protein